MFGQAWVRVGSGGVREGTHLFQIHTLHRAVHAAHHVRHASGHLPHRDGRLDPAADCVDAARQSQQVQLLILLSDRVLRVDFGNVAVVLLDGLRELESVSGSLSKHVESLSGSGSAFFSLAFSAVSSLPALAACRLSCFAVNYRQVELAGCPRWGR